MPNSGYICFSLANQLSISRNLGANASVHDIAKTISESWKALSNRERCTWDERGISREYHSILMKTKGEKRSLTDISVDHETSQKKKVIKKENDRPKRPMSAYIHFAQQKRPIVKVENPTLNGLEITKLVGQKWNEATTQERIPFVQLEELSRVRYKKAMAEWRMNTQKEKQTKRRQPTKKIKKKKSDATCIDNKPPHEIEVKGEGFTQNIESAASSSSSGVWRICSGGETEHEISSKPSNKIKMEVVESRISSSTTGAQKDNVTCGADIEPEISGKVPRKIEVGGKGEKTPIICNRDTNHARFTLADHGSSVRIQNRSSAMPYNHTTSKYGSSTGFQREKIPVIGNRDAIHVRNKLGDHESSVLVKNSFSAMELERTSCLTTTSKHSGSSTGLQREKVSTFSNKDTNQVRNTLADRKSSVRMWDNNSAMTLQHSIGHNSSSKHSSSSTGFQREKIPVNAYRDMNQISLVGYRDANHVRNTLAKHEPRVRMRDRSAMTLEHTTSQTSTSKHNLSSTGFQGENIPIIGNRDTDQVTNKSGEHESGVRMRNSHPGLTFEHSTGQTSSSKHSSSSTGFHKKKISMIDNRDTDQVMNKIGEHELSARMRESSSEMTMERTTGQITTSNHNTSSTGFQREKTPTFGNRDMDHVRNELGDHESSIRMRNSSSGMKLERTTYQTSTNNEKSSLTGLVREKIPINGNRDTNLIKNKPRGHESSVRMRDSNPVTEHTNSQTSTSKNISLLSGLQREKIPIIGNRDTDHVRNMSGEHSRMRNTTSAMTLEHTTGESIVRKHNSSSTRFPREKIPIIGNKDTNQARNMSGEHNTMLNDSPSMTLKHTTGKNTVREHSGFQRENIPTIGSIDTNQVRNKLGEHKSSAKIQNSSSALIGFQRGKIPIIGNRDADHARNKIGEHESSVRMQNSSSLLPSETTAGQTSTSTDISLSTGLQREKSPIIGNRYTN